MERLNHSDRCANDSSCQNGGTCLSNSTCSCPLSHGGAHCDVLRPSITLLTCPGSRDGCHQGGLCVTQPNSGKQFCLYTAKQIKEQFEEATLSTKLCQIKSVDELNAYNMRLYTIIGILLGVCALVALAVMSLLAVRRRKKNKQRRLKNQDTLKAEEAAPLREPFKASVESSRNYFQPSNGELPWEPYGAVNGQGRSSAPCSVVRLLPDGPVPDETGTEGRRRLVGTSSTSSDAASLFSHSDPSLAGSHGAALRQLLNKQHEARAGWARNQNGKRDNRDKHTDKRVPDTDS